LAEGELPWPDQEGEHERDQEVIEEFESVADDRRGEDFLLVACQARLSIENLEHGVSPLARCSWCSGRRAFIPPMLERYAYTSRSGKRRRRLRLLVETAATAKERELT
jgi:hypothetical protein